jgi:hypothetical protein
MHNRNVYTNDRLSTVRCIKPDVLTVSIELCYSNLRFRSLRFPEYRCDCEAVLLRSLLEDQVYSHFCQNCTTSEHSRCQMPVNRNLCHQLDAAA